MVRRSSTENFERIDHLQDRITTRAGRPARPGVAHRAARASHRPTRSTTWRPSRFVPTSFSQPVLTGEFTGLGVTRMLDAIRMVDPGIRFYQASSSARCSARCARCPRPRPRLLPPLPLRRGQGLRPLDHRQLPRVLRPVRLLGHPLQPRVAPPRPGVRHPQDHQRRGPDQARPGRRSCAWATSTPSATGASPATTSRPCG